MAVAQKTLDSEVYPGLKKVAEFVVKLPKDVRYHTLILSYQQNGEQKFIPCAMYADKRGVLQIYNGNNGKIYTRASLERELDIRLSGKYAVNIVPLISAARKESSIRGYLIEASTLLSFMKSLNESLDHPAPIDAFYSTVNTFLRSYRNADKKVIESVEYFLNELAKRPSIYGKDYNKLEKALELIRKIASKTANNQQLITFYKKFALQMMERAHVGNDLLGNLTADLDKIEERASKGKLQFSSISGFFTQFFDKLGRIARDYVGVVPFAYVRGVSDCFGFVALVCNLATYGRYVSRSIPYEYYEVPTSKQNVKDMIRDGDVVCTPDGSFNGTGAYHYGIYYNGHVINFSGRPVEATALSDFVRLANNGVVLLRKKDRA